MATIDKGEKIMDGLLLSQYRESPLLKQYFMSFIGEMDLLFQTIEEVYYGRLLNNAVGTQLDIIGEILQQSRNIDITTINFGFLGVTIVDGFGDTEDTQAGGIFKSLDLSGLSVDPLTDIVYKRVLLCKANLLNKDSASIEEIYDSVIALLGRIPRYIRVGEPSGTNLTLVITLNSSDTRDDEYLLILYMAKYFVPAGVTLTITLI